MMRCTLTERLVLDRLLTRPQATIQQLAAEFCLPASTIVSVVNRLLEKEQIVRGPLAEQPRGRPAVTYRARLPGPAAVISLDGSATAGTLFDPAGEALAQHRVEFVRVEDPEQAIDLIDEQLSDLLSQANVARGDLAFVAIALNALRTGSGIISGSVLPWAGAGLEQQLHERLMVPVHMATKTWSMAEAMLADGSATMLRFHVGDGVSGHSTMRGQAVTGHNALAGELGHVRMDPAGPPCGCGRRGCIEAMVCGPAICRRALQLLEHQSGRSMLDRQTLAGRSARAGIEQLWHAWQAGDHVAILTIDQSIDMLAWALSLAVNLIDPDVVRVDGYVLCERTGWIELLARRVRPLLIQGQRRELVIESAMATTTDQQRTALYAALGEHRTCIAADA